MRGLFTQRVVWPVLLVPSLVILVGSQAGAQVHVWGGMPWQWYTMLVALAIVSAIMTGLTRRIGPTDESFRLGLHIGARRQRQKCAHECGHVCKHDGAGLHALATATDEYPVIPQPRRPSLYVVNDGR